MNTPLRISICICTYNRQKFIGECLQCLAQQTLPPQDWEVIVVDNASTDNTAQIVKAFIAAHPHLPFRYVHEAQKGLSFARNRSIAEARSAGSEAPSHEERAIRGRKQ